MRGSLEVTYSRGADGVPTTSMPVMIRVVTAELTVPSSSWLGICRMRLIVSVAVTE